MKVFSSPVPAPEVDYANYDRDKERKREDEHTSSVKKWLLDNGYNGKLTGKIVTFPVADGYAQYMLADGRKSALIHLPYGDAYNYNDVQFLPKKEIIRRIEADKKFNAMFTKQKEMV